MSTDTHKWIGSYPQVSKKKMMWLNSCGKQHLSSSSVKEVYGDREKKMFTGIFTIASVMSLWQNSDAQAPCQASQQTKIQQGACKEVLQVPSTKTETQSSSVLNANAPLYFREHQRYRSKVTSLCDSSRQTFSLLKPTTFPENPSEGRINELGISKDFGNDFCTIFKDVAGTIKVSNFCRQLQQNCGLQTRKFGECETVQTSMKKRHKNCELQSSSLIVLGILPILSSVLELKNFTELVVSQIHVLKKLISCAIILRLGLLRAVLKKCEYLCQKGHFKVNKTESNEKNLNLNVSSVSVVSQVLSDMAFNQQMYLGGGMGDGEDDEFLREEDEGQDDMNIPEVPDIYQQELGGNGDDAGFWEDHFRDEQPGQVLGGVPGGPVPNHHEQGQLQDEFLNNVIPDHDIMAALCEHANAADFPMQEDFPLFDDELVMGEIMLVDLLGRHDHQAAEAA